MPYEGVVSAADGLFRARGSADSDDSDRGAGNCLNLLIIKRFPQSKVKHTTDLASNASNVDSKKREKDSEDPFISGAGLYVNINLRTYQVKRQKKGTHTLGGVATLERTGVALVRRCVGGVVAGEGGGGRKNGESKHKEGGCTSEHIEQGSALKGVEMLNCLERKPRDASLLYFEWICYFTQKLTPRHWSTLINTWAVNMLPCER